MAIDLGLDDLVAAVSDLPANSMGFAANMISLVEAAFLSDRNPFGINALGDDIVIPPEGELSLPAVNQWDIGVDTFNSMVFPEATGGSGNYAYTLTDSDNSPLSIPGMAFVAATRTISGTPTAANTYPVKYTVNDGVTTLSRIFNIIVAASTSPLSLPDSADRSLTIGVAFSTTLPAATGGTGNYTYTLSNIPLGLGFVPATRLLSGTPSQTGGFLMVYTVDDGSNQVSYNLNYTVTTTTAPTILSVSGTDSSVTKVVGLPNLDDHIQASFFTASFNFPDDWFVLEPSGNIVAVNIWADGRISLLFTAGTGDFVSILETNLYITIASPNGVDFTVRGPSHSTNTSTDGTEPYHWSPATPGIIAAMAFYNALNNGDSMTVTLRYNG